MPTGQQILLLVKFFRVLMHENVDNISKIALKNQNYFKNFFEYSVLGPLWHFVSQNCIYLPKQPFWATTSFNVERFQGSDS